MTALTAVVNYDTQPTGLIGFHVMRSPLSPQRIGALFDYVLASDGVYIHAVRPELEVCFKIESFSFRGVEQVTPLFDFRLPRIPESFVASMIRDANVWAEQGLETLFHLCWSDLAPMDDGWVGYEPEQHRSAGSCKPVADGGSHERAIVEIHSHHSMWAKFSETDDKDETGFRLYAVIGGLPDAPEIRVRVGVYGYFWEIPAKFVMDLPEGVLGLHNTPVYQRRKHG